MRHPILAGWVVGTFAFCYPSYGAIIGINASASIEVQELIDGAPGSNSRDELQLDPGGENLPLVTTTSLLSTDLEGNLVALARGFSVFEDPTRLEQVNPEEFGLEAACFSKGESISYTVASRASETRTIVFTTPGNPLAPPEIEFGVLRTRTIESRVFLSGAVIVWSTVPGRGLDDVFFDLQVTVTRDDTGQALFESSLAMTEETPGEVTTTGPMRFDFITLDELREAGVDEESLAVLQQVQDDGSLLILAIMPQEHRYRYTARADEVFDLSAELSVRVHNAPEGTGVAATLGRPFENLAAFVSEGLDGVDGEGVQRSVNAVTQAKAIGLVEPRGGIRGGTCGAFGTESAVLAGMLFVGAVRRRGKATGNRQ